MIGPLPLPALKARRYRSRLNRRQSPLRMQIVPPATVILGSMTAAMLPIIASEPILPPIGLMTLIAWRLLRPHFWPLWIGFPLGLVDDLFSGQPFGSAAMLWSMILLSLEILDNRLMWRDFLLDWGIATLAVAFGLIGGWWVMGLFQPRPDLLVLVPQMIISFLLFPILIRMIAILDRWRLAS